MGKEWKNIREEIINKRNEIYTSQLNMSVGEFISLYNDNEINLEPAFQRFFKWSEQQETNFIESILLGYPIPSIFVLQRDDGVWDVIDGVQRLSTIYHFAGILYDEESENQIKEPLQLTKAKILTHLDGLYYNLSDKPSLDTASRIDFKRAMIPVTILNNNSDDDTKFELFRRLNTGGSKLTPQEVRNALMLMSNEKAYLALEKFCDTNEFKTFLNLSDSKTGDRTDMDILTRFIVMRHYPNIEELDNRIDINIFLDDTICSIISDKNYNVFEDINYFKFLIEFFNNNIDENYGFQVYKSSKNAYQGGFNWFIFETITWGLAVLNDLNKINSNKEKLLTIIQGLVSSGEYSKIHALPNLRVIRRLKVAKEYAKEVFNLE